MLYTVQRFCPFQKEPFNAVVQYNFHDELNVIDNFIR